MHKMLSSFTFIIHFIYLKNKNFKVEPNPASTSIAYLNPS